MNKNQFQNAYINRHLNDVKYRIDESRQTINEQLISEQVEAVLSSPSLRRKYFDEYKNEMLLEGKHITEEGFGSWLKDKFTKAKDTVKGAVTKVKNVAKGIADVGFLGRGTTILGGSETLDIEKRKQMIGQAEQEVNADLHALSSGLQGAGLKEFDTLTKLKSELDSRKFPNSDSFESDVGLLNAEYKKAVDGFNSKKIDAKTANAIIAVLRHLVIYYQDYKIHDKNLYLNEAEAPAAATQPAGLDAVKGRKQGDVSKSYQAAYGATLPLGLLAGGAALMGLGVAANSDTFQSALAGLKDLKDADVTTIVNKIKPAVVQEKVKMMTKALSIGKGQGITQALEAATGVDLSPSAPLKNFLDPKVAAFLPAVKAAVIAKNGPAGGQAWDQVLAMAKSGKAGNMGQVLQGQFKGTGEKITDLLDVDPGKFAGQAEQIISKTVNQQVQEKVTQAVKIPADTLKNKFLGALGKFAGPVLSGLGLGAMVAGATSGLMRMKGKASSRMSTLKKTVDAFKDVGGQEDAVVPPAEAKPGGPSAPGQPPSAPSPQGEPTKPGEEKPGQKSSEEPSKKPGTGKTVHVFRQGPHIDGTENQSLTMRLRGAGLPNWAIKDITSRVKQELETNGFTVKESLMKKIGVLTEEEEMLDEDAKKRKNYMNKLQFAKTSQELDDVVKQLSSEDRSIKNNKAIQDRIKLKRSELGSSSAKSTPDVESDDEELQSMDTEQNPQNDFDAAAAYDRSDMESDSAATESEPQKSTAADDIFGDDPEAEKSPSESPAEEPKLAEPAAASTSKADDSIRSTVREFGSDTTVKNEKTVVKDENGVRNPGRKFTRKELFDNPEEFIKVLSAKEKMLYIRLPDNPNMEYSKLDFFKMTSDERKALYDKVKQGQVFLGGQGGSEKGDIGRGKEGSRNQKGSGREYQRMKSGELSKPELGTFKISDLRTMLRKGHEEHGEVQQVRDPASGKVVGDRRIPEKPIPDDQIRAAQEIVRQYLGAYLKDTGIKLRESQITKIAVEFISDFNKNRGHQKSAVLTEGLQLRWKKLAGII